ncbi:MAG: NAD-dependent DNA ligase LigA [Lachnospiraceae bacterium]|nr:NAD-dependent DNA ligase LigA [Lachnospiraceae bacterium]
MDKKEEMRSLIEKLKEASRAYYAEDKELMSNYEYDELSDRLQRLEEETGIILPDSPSVNVGYEAVDELPKERHPEPMLSLGKTKSREELRDFLSDKKGLLSWKLDGLTVVLEYENGTLSKAVTRGNGEVGEVITGNARTFKNLPHVIPYKGKLILRGEAVITYSDFEKINASMPDASVVYKNPRNLCSGSVRQLNSAVTAERNVRFYAFALVSAEGVDFGNSREEQFAFLAGQGFDVVEHKAVTADTILDTIEYFAHAIEDYDIPSDGLVLSYDDLAYSASLGRTAKAPRHSIAFKWADETAETTLREVEWSASRTGLINPVAIFDPVELEGTTVSRASVHNVSIVKSLRLGIGDRITVYKANMIIPQIAENLTRSGSLEIPSQCPVCGGKTRVSKDNDAEVLLCTNPACDAKKLKSFAHFVSRDAMNIDGISEATLEKFINAGFLHSFRDLFTLETHRDEIALMDGFGEKSCNNMIESAERAKQTTLPKLIYAMGIPGIGLANAKVIVREFGGDATAMLAADAERLSSIDGIGPVLAEAFYGFFQKEENRAQFTELLSMMEIEASPQADASALTLAGKVFVVTGSLVHFENRNALKEEVEKRGGKVTGSVTGKTDALINNDTTSMSTKNKTAKSLGVPILSEEDFIAQYLD